MVIPIVPPEDIPSREKRFFSEIIKYIDDINPSYEEKIKFFDVMVEGSKFTLESIHKFEKILNGTMQMKRCRIYQDLEMHQINLMIY